MKSTDGEHHPSGYDYRSKFQDIQMIRGFEGGSVYTANDAGRPVLISDEGTLLDILAEDDSELTDRAIAVRRFASEEERERYIHERWGSKGMIEDLNELEADATSPASIDGSLGVDTTTGHSELAFKLSARARQAAFRATLPIAARTPTDQPWASHDFLLALGHEEETLYPSIRGAGGALDYFRARGARWWRSPATGDAKGDGPTRNLTSSQVACVNLLLPLLEKPSLLAAMLRVVDPTIETVERIHCEGPTGQALSAYVELEWTGRVGTLEGRGSRGAHATSADACLIGVTSTGERKAFLLEFKYIEAYRNGVWQGEGEKGAERKALHAERYTSPSSCFSGAAALDDVLYDPFYQIVRLGLLGDALREDEALHLADVTVIVVCPSENTAYRERVTSPALRRLFPDETTVAGVSRHLWKRPEGFRMIDPKQLVDAVRTAGDAPEVERWSGYMRDRYGW
jgi:hypothetical protein